MPEPQQVQQNAGTADQLQKGEAGALNDAMPTGTELAASGQPDVALQPQATGAAPPEQDMSEPDLAAQSDYEPQYQPEGADDDFVTGPTTRPDEPVTTGAFGGPRRGLSPDLVAALPVFEEAANLPDAPPQIRVLMGALAQLMES